MAETPDHSDPPGGDSGPRLESVGDVHRELAKVYRSMRMGRIPVPEGNGLTQTLVYLAKVTEMAAEAIALERLARLEGRRRERNAEPARGDPQAH